MRPREDELVAANLGAMYRLAVRLLGDEAEAEDVVQVAFERAFEALRAGRFRGESSVTTWLYRIVVNAAFDARRGRARHASTRSRGDLPGGTPGSLAARPDAGVELRELRDALEELPDDQRAALALKELQGLSTKETAEVLERSEGAVEQLLVRARATLRERLER